MINNGFILPFRADSNLNPWLEEKRPINWVKFGRQVFGLCSSQYTFLSFMASLSMKLNNFMNKLRLAHERGGHVSCAIIITFHSIWSFSKQSFNQKYLKHQTCTWDLPLFTINYYALIHTPSLRDVHVLLLVCAMCVGEMIAMFSAYELIKQRK